MAFGEVVFFTVGYTSASASASVASTRPNYPIKKKYRQVENTRYPSSSSYEIYDAQEYWFPFDDLEVSEENYIPYSTGDEFGWNELSRKHKPDAAPANSDKSNYPIFEPGTRLYYSEEIYEATDYYFNWTDTSLSPQSNPYNNNRINKWKRIDDESSSWTQYWYHPRIKQFFPLEDSESLLQLPDDGDFEATKWDIFNGSTDNVNITTLTSSVVNELIATGSTPLAAAAAVASIDNKVIESTSSQISPLDISTNALVEAIAHADKTTISDKPVTATVVAASSSSTASNTSAGTSSVTTIPAMIQEYKNALTGAQEIDRFDFLYAPNNISYTNIGSQWSEIERVNNAPIVDFKNFKHMKVSFEFVVSDKTDGISSLYSSCEEQLFQLRKIAARPEFVRFVNLDTLFNRFLIYPQLLLNGNNTAFAIVDMSISSVQRTRPTEAGVYSGEISRATVNMTVQEVSTSSPELILMPRIVAAPLRPGLRPPYMPGDDPGEPLFLDVRWEGQA